MSLSSVDSNTSDTSPFTIRVSIFIGVLAVLLAFCSLGGGNTTKDANFANVSATNTWAFFQAKNIRRSDINLTIDTFRLTLAAQPNMSPADRKTITDKIAEYEATAKRLTSDPVKQEGLDELFAKAKALEATRDLALRKDPYFDWAGALLQIAVVLASVSLVARSRLLIGMSAAFALIGTVLMIDGYTLLLPLPFLG
jgi:uncharacterized membrane protein YgdD (TMEM256/DUF423 family)